jgi:HEAT repeat protein
MEIGIMSENGSGGEWFEELPHTGRIYQLIEDSKVSERRETRIRALRALGESEDPRAVRPLVEYTHDDASEIRRFATEGLYKLRSARGVEALYERVKDRQEEWGTRKLAADALGEIRSHRAVEILAECLLNGEEDLSIREYVAGVLARTATETARRALVRSRDEEGSSPMGNVAEEALRTLDTSSSDKQRDWSLQNSSTENHPIKEGAAIKR